MKKTLLITLEYPPTIGGIATYVHELAGALDPTKTVVIAPMHQDAAAWDDTVPYTVIRKNMFFPKFIWPQWLRLYFQARKIVKEHHIELVMIHHILPVGYIGQMLQKKFGIPFLVFSHGTDLVTGTRTKWKRKRVTQIAEKAAQLIFNSESLQSRFLQVLPQFEGKSRVMYPCPSTAFSIEPAQEELDTLRSALALQGKTVLLSVGRLTEGKGFTHLSRLLPEIVKRVPHLAWVVVGDGPKRQAIIDNVQKVGLQSIVRMIGGVQPIDLVKYYHLADIFVVLTHPDEGREEGLGLVFLEASAAGLPIVAGKSGGVEEAVLHTQTGIVVDLYQGDQGIIDAIAEVGTNKEYAERLGMAAKSRIETSFIWSHQIEQLRPWLQ